LNPKEIPRPHADIMKKSSVAPVVTGLFFCQYINTSGYTFQYNALIDAELMLQKTTKAIKSVVTLKQRGRI